MEPGDILFQVELLQGIYMEIINGVNLIVWNLVIIIQQENINHAKDPSLHQVAKEIVSKIQQESIVQISVMQRMLIK